MESIDFDKSLSIRARVVLSEAQYSDIGELPDIVKVIRHGIDETPRDMELYEIAWSNCDNEIKEELLLLDKETKNSLPRQCYVGNSERELARQNLIINDLLDMLIAKDVLKGEQVEELKARSIGKGRWRRIREFYRLSIDLDEYKSLEEEFGPIKNQSMP
jgi:hypothetical protein